MKQVLQDKARFTDEQLAVINSNAKKIVVTAGAGTGKTTTMVARIKRLIEEDPEIRVGEKKILYITFTNKAAESQKEKIKEEIGDSEDKITTTTIHKFCAKEILPSNIQKICDIDLQAYINNFIEAHKDNADCAKVLERCYKENGEYDLKQSTDLTEKIKDYSLHILLGKDFSALQEEGKTCNWLPCLNLYRVAKLINKKLEQDKIVPLHMIPYAAYAELSRDKEKLNTIKKKYKYLIVDEFQDINKNMYQVFDFFDNITVVGDKKQAIYGFNGGDSHYFDELLNSKNDPVRHFKLSQNFRSTKEILNLANDIFPGDQLNTDKSGSTPEMLIVNKEKDGQEKIIDTINRLNEMGVEDNDIMVISARNSTLTNLQNDLNKETFRSYLKGNKTAERTEELIFAWGYLKYLYDDLSECSKKYYTNCEKRFKTNLAYRIGEILRLYNKPFSIEDVNICLSSILNKQTTPVNECDEIIQNFLFKEFNNCLELYQYVKTHIISEYLSKGFFEDNFDKKTQIDEVYEDIKSLLTMNGGNGDIQYEKDILKDLYISRSLDNEIPVEEQDVIKLLTIHKAKGLESPTVIVFDAPNKKFSDSDPYSQQKEKAYVALTRAKTRLIIVCNSNSYYYNFRKYCEISSSPSEKLLSELEKELKIDRKDFGLFTIPYSYYAYEGEFKRYEMTFKYFLHNFSIIEKADEIMKLWLKEEKQGKYVNKLIDFLYNEYCPPREIFGGDPIFYEGKRERKKYSY